jgi:hypothetical protein
VFAFAATEPATLTVPYAMRIVPVHVPLTSCDGSAAIVTRTPAGGTMPDDGTTVSHGLSAVAMNVAVPSGSPGTKSWNVTGVVLPAGTLTLKFGVSGDGTGATTTRTVGEYALGDPHSCIARTR